MTSGSSIDFKEMKVHILSDKDDLCSFECRNKDINDFIRDEAKQFQFERLGVSYIFTYEEKPVGFVTLSMADLRKEKMKSEDRLVIGKENYPALQISQLAVCVKFERKDIGTELCNFSLGKAYEFSEKVGCRFLVLNAKKDVIGFYEKYGFRLLPKQEGRKEPVMFLNIFDKKY
jgi:GNAT superfamily N-acetyltransferase